MNEEQVMAAVGQDDVATLEDLAVLAEGTEALGQLVVMLHEQARAGVLEARASEVHQWARVTMGLILQISRGVTRWDAMAAMMESITGKIGKDDHERL
jgi:hypothetical protein